MSSVSNEDENQFQQEREEQEDTASDDESDVEADVSTSSKRSFKRKSTGAARSTRRVKAVREDVEDDDAIVSEFSANASPNLSKLFQVVKHPDTPLSPFARGWTQSYKKDRSGALLELANFILQSCGVQFNVTLDNIEKDDVDDLLQEVASQSELTANNYPLVSREKDMKKFRSRFLEFWKKLFTCVEGDILFEDEFADFVGEWLTGVASASRSSFRHTATEATIQAVSSLIDIAKRHEKRIEVVTKQLATEERKKRTNAAKIAQLKQDLTDNEEHKVDVESFITSLFQGVFVHRNRDKNAVVRTLCMSSLASWMLSHPGFFLEDKFLKYIGWSLNDKDVNVRLASVQAILSLYEEESYHEKLELFTLRFKPRLLEMTCDVDAKVAAAAIDVASKMLLVNLFEDEDGENIPSLIWDEDRKVSRAAGRFTYFDTFTDESDEKPTLADIIADVDRILKVFAGYCPLAMEEEQKGTKMTEEQIVACTEQLVDSMWSHVDTLRNWKVLHNVLTASEGKSADAKLYKDVDTTGDALKVLAYIIRACAMKATGVLFPKTRVSPKNKEIIEEQTTSFVAFFIPRMSKLLTIFQSQTVILSPLIDIVRFIPLQYYTKMYKDNFEQTVLALKSIFSKNADTDVLSRTAQALEHLSYDSDNNPYAANALSIVQQLASELKEALGNMLKNNMYSRDEEEVEAMGALIARAHRLLSMVDVEELHMNAQLHDLLSDHASDEKGSTMVIEEVSRLALIDLVTRFQALSPEKPDAEEMKQIKASMLKLMSSISSILQRDVVSQPVRVVAFRLLSDLLSIFNERLRKTVVGRIALRLSSEEIQMYRDCFFTLIQSGDSRVTETAFMCVCQALNNNARSLDVLGAEVLCYIGMYTANCDVHIKRMMTHLREMGDSMLLNMQLSALKREYIEGTYDSVLELSHKLVMFHALDPNKRSFKVFLARGIDHALSEVSVNSNKFDFLGCALLPYVSRSSLHDVAIAIKYLESARKNAISDEEFDNLDTSILEDFQDALVQKAEGGAPKMAKTSPTKKIRLEGDSLAELFDDDDDGDASMASSRSRRSSIRVRRKSAPRSVKKKTPAKKKAKSKPKKKFRKRSRFA